MVSSIECRSEISFYMKELTFFKSWVFIPNWAQQLECSIFFLFSNFSAPLRYSTHSVRDVYFFVRGRIIFGDMFSFIPNIAQFSFVRKKTYSYCERRIFFVRGRIFLEMCFYLSPILHNFHSCGRKKQTDKQTTFESRLSSKNGYNYKEKRNKVGWNSTWSEVKWSLSCPFIFM